MFGRPLPSHAQAHQRRAAGEASARRIGREPHPVDRNADQPRGPLVEAHAIDPASPGGGVQDKTARRANNGRASVQKRQRERRQQRPPPRQQKSRNAPIAPLRRSAPRRRPNRRRMSRASRSAAAAKTGHEHAVHQRRAAFPRQGRAQADRSAGAPAFRTSMARTLASETIPPTEMSMPAPPHRMTKVWPSAASARIVENCSTAVTVERASEDGCSTARPATTTIQSSARMATMGDARGHRALVLRRTDGLRRLRDSRPETASAPSTASSRKPVTTGCQSEGTPIRSRPFCKRRSNTTPNDRAEKAYLAARHRRAAKNHGGDRFERERRADGHLHIAIRRHIEARGKAAERAADDESDDLDPAHANSREPRFRLGITDRQEDGPRTA